MTDETYSADERLLAKCGWMEARGEGVGGCYPVMHVVCNRVQSPEFPDTIHGVVYQKNQFSWTRPDNPEYGLEPSGPIYEACLEAAPLVIAGDSDPTDGALYYANLTTADPAGWFYRQIVNRPDKHPFLLKIGRHSFFL